MWSLNALACLIFATTCQLYVTISNNYTRCHERDLVVYKLIFETNWTKENFPKQYPENRPPAHWSKVIGMSHDENFILFRVGDMANKDFKLFAETGKTDVLGKPKEFNNNILDEFSTSSIRKGVGKAQAKFFVDGNHSMVSLAVKIIPSPDWFVGVDSLALCSEGNWLDSITIEASPIDAGTDSGFTFTAPNWETEPQERITKITSKYPKHPANSFYYPQRQDLPVIATFHLIKQKFYQLSRVLNVKQVKVYQKKFLNGTRYPTKHLKKNKNDIRRDDFGSEKRMKYKMLYKKKFKKHYKSSFN